MYTVAAVKEFIGEGDVGGVFQILVYEISLLVAALEHQELVLQFYATHISVPLPGSWFLTSVRVAENA